MRGSLIMAVAVCCLAALGCRSPGGGSGVSGAATGTVTGTVTYRERMAVPPGAELEVELLDVTQPHSPGVRMAATTVKGRVLVPVSFSLTYNADQIDPEGEYIVQARITAGGSPLFVTTATHYVLTKGRPNEVNIVLRRAQ
jgi:putative lipoprotein